MRGASGAALHLEGAHAVRLGQRPRVGVAKFHDVAEHLVDRAPVALALTDRLADKVLQLGQQRRLIHNVPPRRVDQYPPVGQQRQQLAPELSESEFFEVFAAELALKDYDLSYEEVRSGIVDGRLLGVPSH